jgi:hypothetical protein
MSQTATHEVRCTCGAILSVFCADSINAERHPHMREAILARTLHVFRCDACLASIAVDKPFVYIDLARRQLYGVQPPALRALEREHGEALVNVFERAIGPRAGEAARAMFDGEPFHVRLCYGNEALREKLVARDAGLRDLPIEALKAELLAGTPALREAGVIALYLDRVDDRELVFLAERIAGPIGPAPDAPADAAPAAAPDAPPGLLEQAVTAERARYDALAAVPWTELLERFPGIASGPHVSVLRWTLAPADGDTAPPDGDAAPP